MNRQITQDVLSAPHEVNDPELGVSVVDLGLVFSIDVVGNTISVFLAMISPACPLGGLIAETTATAIGTRGGPSHGARVAVDRTVEWSPENAVPAVRARFEDPSSRFLEALRSGIARWQPAP